MVICVLLLYAASAEGQQNASQQESSLDVTKEVIDLRAMVVKLQARVDELEKRSDEQGTGASSGGPAKTQSPTAAPSGLSAQKPQAQNSRLESVSSSAPNNSELLPGTTINILLDGYYGYNFNNPIGRVNLLRAYDVSSNAFSLNQAALVIENAADPEKGKRFGLRLDLQYGQATETLQGNPLNEPRPGIYRNIFQAYGTYVIPVGSGLTLDFGKLASSLGIEGNYTKDQMNYSRSYWFNFLPFYHMGIRANYKFNDKVAFNYWIVNGTQQTEPFNGFKDQFFGLVIQPTKAISWSANYYLGQEHPDAIFYPNGGAPAGLPTQQGVPFQLIPNAPNGKLHILDSYVNWNATKKLTLAGEADYVIERLLPPSAPSHTDGVAAYVKYQLAPKLFFSARAEYLSDRGGLFSGVTQALKENTVTAGYQVTPGFLMMGEWRRDFSNRPYFLTSTLGNLKDEQNTAMLGLVWWLGAKQASW